MDLARWLLASLIGAGIAVLAATVSGWVAPHRDFVLGVTAGIVSSTLVVLILGVLRSPRLLLQVGDVSDLNRPQGPAFRFVHVNVSNPSFRILGWQLRRPATFCRAKLEYGDLGARVPRFTIDGRWTSLPEPVQNLPEGQIVDLGLALIPPRESFVAGEGSPIPVALKQASVQDCFAFNNRSYLYANWSNPDWVLGTGTYWVRITVKSAEVEMVGVFYLSNTGTGLAGVQVQNVP
jgi:hypothetical protein